MERNVYFKINGKLQKFRMSGFEQEVSRNDIDEIRQIYKLKRKQAVMVVVK